MSTDLMTKEKHEIAPVSEQVLSSYLATFTGANALLEPERKQFLEIARAYNLNPFKREIYCVAYGQGQYRKLSIITGYEVYLKRAERTGKLDGWKTVVEGKGSDMKAKVIIFRKDWTHTFEHEVLFEEVAKYKDGKLQSLWQSSPTFMLKKVAIAQAFRMCFPDEFGGMPYISDELPDEMTKGFNNPIPTSGEGTAQSPSYIPPENKAQPEAKTEPKTPKEEHEMLKEGEIIPKWFWNITKDERAKYVPEGCHVKKIDGVFRCVR